MLGSVWCRYYESFLKDLPTREKKGGGKIAQRLFRKEPEWVGEEWKGPVRVKHRATFAGCKILFLFAMPVQNTGVMDLKTQKGNCELE